MVYNSKKSWLIPVAIIMMLIMAIMPVIDGVWEIALFIAIIIAWFLWMWFDTFYIIRNDELYYESSFIKGTVQISTVHEIVIHTKGLHSCSLKPALAMKGLIIKYNRYDDMFISPENQDEFIAHLQAVNPDIKVSN